MSNVYEGYFSNWADVCSRFDVEVPEPDEVLLAEYDIDGYEGSALVIYRNGDNFYYNSGGHCSCYGLEGQWDPEEYSSEQFVAAYRRGQWYKRIPEELVRRIENYGAMREFEHWKNGAYNGA